MIGVASFSYGPTAVLFNNKNIIVASPVALKKRRKVDIKFVLLQQPSHSVLKEQ